MKFQPIIKIKDKMFTLCCHKTFITQKWKIRFILQQKQFVHNILHLSSFFDNNFHYLRFVTDEFSSTLVVDVDAGSCCKVDDVGTASSLFEPVTVVE